MRQADNQYTVYIQYCIYTEYAVNWLFSSKTINIMLHLPICKYLKKNHLNYKNKPIVFVTFTPAVFVVILYFTLFLLIKRKDVSIIYSKKKFRTFIQSELSVIF